MKCSQSYPNLDFKLNYHVCALSVRGLENSLNQPHGMEEAHNILLNIAFLSYEIWALYMMDFKS